jgi:phage baseplate assembly protein W
MNPMPSFRPPPTEHLLCDIAIHAVHRELRPVYRLTETLTDTIRLPRAAWDFVPRDGLENLAQAVILRLLTPRGELAALGHPDYGSRVHELIGRENDGPRRNLLRLFILEALKAEPRIDKVAELRVEPSPGTRSTVDVLLRVKPVAATELVTIGPFSIELAV